MSLEGSLETVAVPEVLRLLADTAKSGELLVDGDRGQSRLWFDAGKLTGFQVARCDLPEDALFDLLRVGSGRFSFESGAGRPDGANQVGGEEGGAEVAPVLEVAQARLAEWSDIVAVVPSLDHQVSLVAESPRQLVKFDAGQWALVVAIGDGRRVSDVLAGRGLAEFEGCKAVKSIVDLGLAAIGEPVAVEDSYAAFEAVDAPAEDGSVHGEFDDAVAAALESVPEEPVSADSLVVSEEYAGVEIPAADFTFEAVNGGEAAHEDFTYGEEPVYSEPAGEESAQSPDDLAPWSVHLDGAQSNGTAVDGDYEPTPVPYPEAHDYSNGSNGSHEAADDYSSRAALEALIAEIPGDGADAPAESAESYAYAEEAPDGLADRGPWTSHELASLDQMGGWRDEQAAEVPVAAESFYGAEEPEASVEYAEVPAASEGEAEPESEEVAEPQPEPVNRGLLLKFLSSVRS